ncbi:MAG: hypothetical protein A2V81_04460 [Candidatus Abawacabacteria bacterium RBG_16_42_10]|uniref:DUF3467 domain-containing protein n=1 Tax=Candidatus Abawacabacteria bacterium RBG_16_42_10 TaxID=1817814 RepID=A0A1F4XJ72_9BACT|nr:MAG: hypothetical protein A2V81_04460 [Candidatus Abawacabacteria bacterium RBG_16_42_10]
MAQQPEQNQNMINVQIKDDMQSGVYANAASVSVKENDVLIDFGYILPGVSPTTIKVQSRVNLSHTTAEQFLGILQNALLDFRNRKKEGK